MTYIKTFAQAMLRASNKQSSVAAGCTYIGQMIAHEIVAPTSRNPLTDRASVSWALNLNSIYDDLKFDNAPALFNYTTLSATNKRTKAYDFIREIGNTKNSEEAILTEKRNDENSIVSQLHVFWQRLHNKLVTEYGLRGDVVKKQVTLAFQLVVIHDLLHQLMPYQVFKQYFVHNNTYLAPSFLNTSNTQVPDFFSKASFRFGHTMVRPMYDLNEYNTHAELATLFNKHNTLNLGNAIDWKTFFYGQNAMSIDTFISDTMGNIPRNEARTPAHIIPQLNLEASQTLCANCFINQLKSQANWSTILSDCKLTVLEQTDIQKASFKSVESNITRLSLWPYLLLEAQVQSNGKKLGVLGAMLNAEVLKLAMLNANNSVYDKKNKGNYCLPSALAQMGELGQYIVKSLKQRGADSKRFDASQKFPIMDILIDFNK